MILKFQQKTTHFVTIVLLSPNLIDISNCPEQMLVELCTSVGGALSNVGEPF